MEFAVVGVLILIPLVWTEVLPKTPWAESLLAPAPPPPPIPAEETWTAQPVRSARRVFSLQSLEEPRRNLPPVAIADDIPPVGVLGDAPGGFPGELSSAIGGGFFSVLGVAAPPAIPAIPKVDVRPPPDRPLPVGGKVQSAKLIRQPSPVYPAIAKSARIQGTVVLQAIIGKDGTVRDLKVLSASSPLLIQSARDAVKQWVYQPTLLDGEPVEVITEISVTFSLR